MNKVTVLLCAMVFVLSFPAFGNDVNPDTERYDYALSEHIFRNDITAFVARLIEYRYTGAYKNISLHEFVTTTDGPETAEKINRVVRLLCYSSLKTLRGRYF
jgi:hypothetical protein